MVAFVRAAYRSVTRRISPFVPEVMTWIPSVLSLGLRSFFPVRLGRSCEVPFSSVRNRMAWRAAAFKKFFFTRSWTKTTSGAYGEVPPKLKRPATRAFAAASTSAVASTTPMVGASRGLDSTVGVRVAGLPLWITCIHVLRNAASSTLACAISRVSGSRDFCRTFWTSAGSARRVCST